MKKPLVLFVTTLFLFAVSCRKESGLDQSCGDGEPVFREINGAVAMIHAVDGGSFQIIEENTYDTRLLPCNLPEEFKMNKLKVIITGKTLATAQTGICCVEKLVLKDIRRQ
ncbi:hypothetical protein [Pollutibacter soli]|uniref:hypothetical protein n=1 Tax=Pollutibacter soli TaxID=3034157 RepID=UPI003013AEFE